MKEIVGFIGVIGSGKNYQKDLLLKKGFKGLDFKDSLIEMAEDLIGYKIEDYEKFKASIVGMDALSTPLYMQAYPMAMTGRRLLQRLGTEVMRKRDPGYWVKQWIGRATEYLDAGYGVACADVRFRNEVESILTFGKCVDIKTRIVFCDYHSERYDDKSPHESEKLAQYLLKKGFKDGDTVTRADLPPANE